MGKGEGMVVSTGYFFDFVLGHGGVEVELPEVIDLSGDTYFPEEQGAGHVDMSFGVDDGSVGACGGDLFNDSAEALYGEGLVGRFIGSDGKFAVLVATP